MRHIRLEGTDYPICSAPLGEINIDTQKGTHKKHERELLVDVAWKSDCDECRAPLLKHIGVLAKSKGNRRNTTTSPVRMQSACGLENKQPYVLVATESDCNNCRAALLIGPVQEKGMMVRGPKTWEPEPMENADEIMESAQRSRDGR